jgi:hypothetical protein
MAAAQENRGSVPGIHVQCAASGRPIDSDCGRLFQLCNSACELVMLAFDSDV